MRKCWLDLAASTEHSRILQESVQRNELPSSTVPDQWYVTTSKHLTCLLIFLVFRFRDLASLRCKLCLALHQKISDRLCIEEEKLDDVSSVEQDNYIELLMMLKSESAKRFLDAIRIFLGMLVCLIFLFLIRSMLTISLSQKKCGTDLLFSTALASENLPIYLSHLISVPALEETAESPWTLSEKIGVIGE